MGEKVWCDWMMALGPFHENLLRIGSHIREHDIIQDAGLYAAQVDEADRMYKEWRDAEWAPGIPLDEFDAEVERRWWAYWIYVGEHLRGWWD